MKKHSVPQNIMDVEFKLIGSLTVKQFTYVAFAALFALFVYFLNLPAIIGYPIMLSISALGAALAFMKINEQPFGTWLGNFISNLFGSQRRVYRKSAETSPAYLREGRNSSPKASKSEPTKKYRLTADKPFSGATGTAVKNDVATDIDDPFDEQNALQLDKYFQADSSGREQTKINESEKQETTSKNNEPKAEILTPKSPGNVQTSKQVSSTKRRFKIKKTRSDTMQENSPQVVNKLQPNMISGFVTDAQGQPITEIPVQIASVSNEQMNTTIYTDENGKFILAKQLPNGIYQITPQVQGLAFPDYKLELTGKLVPIYKYMAQ